MEHELPRAAAAGDVEQLRRLLAAGADADARDEQGVPSLHLAARAGHADAVSLLLDAGADLTAQDPLGWPPLPVLCSRASRLFGPIRRLVVDRRLALQDTATGADLALSEAAGEAILFRDSDEGRRQSEGSLAVVRLLLEHGADVDGGPRAAPPLVCALAVGRTDVVRVLLDAGADVNRPRAGDGATPLMIAALLHQEEAVRLLLDHRADVHARAGGGATALHYAAFGVPAPESLRLLLDGGADPNARADAGAPPLILPGETPLHVAVRSTAATASRLTSHLLDSVALLLSRGADPWLRDAEGRTALQRARRRRLREVAALLEAHHRDDA